MESYIVDHCCVMVVMAMICGVVVMLSMIAVMFAMTLVCNLVVMVSIINILWLS